MPLNATFLKSDHFALSIKTALLGLVCALPVSGAWADTPLELELNYVAPRQQNQVAFVPFAGDTLISPIIINDLNHSNLSVTSQNLPQAAHSSADLGATLSAWQQLAIPYLVVGSTRSDQGQIVVDFEVVDLRSGRIVGGKQSQRAKNSTQDLRYAAHVIADKIYELITGIEGDFSGKIAYVEEFGSGKNKTSVLKVMDADGENAKTLNQIRGSIFAPTWSPDGRSVAYSMQRPNGYPVIYVQSVDGGQARLVTPYKGNNLSPSFSPDGSRLLFSSSFEGNADIYQISLGSGQLQKLVSLPSNEVQPSYAPDGRSFVFVSDKTGENHPKIYRYDFATGRISQVSQGGYAASPQYSNDGQKIAFLNGRTAAVMNTSGAVLHNLETTGIDEAPRFSPNDQRVVYASRQGNHGVLTIKSLNGGRSFGKSAQGIIRSPVWSPKKSKR